jgi:hypothetical protein
MTALAFGGIPVHLGEGENFPCAFAEIGGTARADFEWARGYGDRDIRPTRERTRS